MKATEQPPREKMTLERARGLSVLLVGEVADLLAVRPNWVYKNARKIPGQLRELKGVVRFSAPTVVAWLSGAFESSGKNLRE